MSFSQDYITWTKELTLFSDVPSSLFILNCPYVYFVIEISYIYIVGFHLNSKFKGNDFRKVSVLLY